MLDFDGPEDSANMPCKSLTTASPSIPLPNPRHSLLALQLPYWIIAFFCYLPYSPKSAARLIFQQILPNVGTTAESIGTDDQRNTKHNMKEKLAVERERYKVLGKLKFVNTIPYSVTCSSGLITSMLINHK